jgi:DNA modification methylase
MQNEMEIKENTIYNEDCLKYMERLKEQNIKVDCIVLDPPYFNVVNEKWDKEWKSLEEYLNWIENIFEKCNAVSKYNCNLWLFGFPYQLSYLIPLAEKHGFTYRQHITIDKGLQSVAGRTSDKLKMFPTSTEYVIYFHKEARHIIKEYLQEKKKESKKTSSEINLHLGKATNGGGTWSTIAGLKQKNIQYPTRTDWDKLQELFGKFDIEYDDYVFMFNIETRLTDVWSDINFYDRTYKKVHPTQKPFKLIERLLNCTTKEGYKVLDPFMGSGMTGLVCKKMGRTYYGCEKDEKYCNKTIIYMQV